MSWSCGGSSTVTAYSSSDKNQVPKIAWHEQFALGGKIAVDSGFAAIRRLVRFGFKRGQTRAVAAI